MRDIRVSKAGSFETLFASETRLLTYTDSYTYALYTNNIQPYYRAPQVFVGFPTRYNDHDITWTENMEYLPDRAERYARYLQNKRYATTTTDALFMTSRDGLTFDRFSSAWATAGQQHSGNWVYGDCYFAYGMIETPSSHSSEIRELSLYAFEGKFKPDASRLYRYTTRIDGFACYQAPSAEEVRVTTKPFVLSGTSLSLNFATDGAGSVVVRILDENGSVINESDYTSYTMFGDQVDRPVTFSGDLSALQGRTVRLEFSMRSAEIYSFKFD